MYINEESLRITGVTSIEYLNWCKAVNKKPGKTETKREFFKNIKNGKIYRDKETKKIIYKGEYVDDKSKC